MNQYAQKGFTLLELLVVIAIVGLVSAIAVPSMREAVGKSDISAVSQDLVGSFQLARLEAVKRISRTQVNAKSVDDTAAWTNGYQITQSIEVNGTATDKVLKVGESLKTNINVASATSSTAITFDSRGYAGQEHTIEICDAKDKSIEGRQVKIAASGHVTSAVFNCNAPVNGNG